MAYYHIFPEIDSTIYSHPDRLHLNTGHDEILEVVKEKGWGNAKVLCIGDPGSGKTLSLKTINGGNS